MSSYPVKVAVAITVVLVLAIGLQHLAFHTVTGAGASFLLRALGLLIAAGAIPLLLWLRSCSRA